MIVGILGGSGLYDSRVSSTCASTPSPRRSARRRRRSSWASLLSDAVELVFVPRHGRGHRLLPSEINYRANVHALKQLGVEKVISVSAVGSLREGLVPGDLVRRGSVHRQDPPARLDLLRRWHRRPRRLRRSGVRALRSCTRRLSVRAAAEERATGGAAARVAPGRHLRVHGGAAVLDARRVAAAPELGRRRDRHDRARPKPSCAARPSSAISSLALVTDYDCWHPEEEAVTRRRVVEVLLANVAAARGDPARGAAAAAELAGVRLRSRGGARDHDIARGDSRAGAGTAEGALREVLREQRRVFLAASSARSRSIASRPHADKRVEVLGGAASFVSVAAGVSSPSPVRLIGVVGDDFPRRTRSSCEQQRRRPGRPRARRRADASAGPAATRRTSRRARRWTRSSTCSRTSTPSCRRRGRIAGLRLARQHRSGAAADVLEQAAAAEVRGVRHHELLDRRASGPSW